MNQTLIDLIEDFVGFISDKSDKSREMTLENLYKSSPYIVSTNHTAMNNPFKIIITALISTLFLFSCDNDNDPVPDESSDNDTTTTVNCTGSPTFSASINFISNDSTWGDFVETTGRAWSHNGWTMKMPSVMEGSERVYYEALPNCYRTITIMRWSRYRIGNSPPQKGELLDSFDIEITQGTFYEYEPEL